MAKTQSGKEYMVSFAGTYRTTIKGAAEARAFEIDGKLNDELIKPPSHVLTAFSRYIVPELMRTKYPDFESLQTWKVVKSVCTSHPNDPIDLLDLLSGDDLLDYVDRHDIPVNHMLYGDDDQLRQALVEYEKDPEAYKRSEATLTEKRKGRISQREAVRKLNAAPATHSATHPAQAAHPITSATHPPEHTVHLPEGPKQKPKDALDRV